MISKFIPIGMLFIFITSGCVTTPADKPQSKSSQAEDDEIIEALLVQYLDDPEVLLVKVLEVISEEDENYFSLLARLYFAVGDFGKAKSYILADSNYIDKPDSLKLLVIIEKATGSEFYSIAQRMLSLDGNNTFALNIKAEYHMNNEELDKAEEILTESFYIDSENSKTLIMLGDLALKRVDNLNLGKKKVLSQQEESLVKSYYNLALDYYSRIPDSKSPAYYVKLSSVYRKLGMKLEAVKSLTRAIELDPDDIWNYYDRGKLYFYMGENHLAIPDLKKAYSIDSEHFFTNVFLGRAHFAMNQIDDSYYHYKKALSIKPSYDPAYKDLSILTYIKGNIEESLEYQISLYKRESRRDPFIPLYLVNTLIDLGREDDARKILLNLVKYEKNSTMKGIYNYYLDPDNTGDDVLNDALNHEDSYFRVRLSYYVACALDRGGVNILSDSILYDVAEADVDFESKLASYKLGDKNE